MTAKRVLAVLGVVVLVAMYIVSLVFAIMGSDKAMIAFMISVFCTIAIPIMIHLFLMMNNAKKGRSVMANPYLADADDKNE